RVVLLVRADDVAQALSVLRCNNLLRVRGPCTLLSDARYRRLRLNLTAGECVVVQVLARLPEDLLQVRRLRLPWPEPVHDLLRVVVDAGERGPFRFRHGGVRVRRVRVRCCRVRLCLGGGPAVVLAEVLAVELVPALLLRYLLVPWGDVHRLLALARTLRDR